MSEPRRRVTPDGTRKCRCGHIRDAHGTFSPRNDRCALCDCKRYRGGWLWRALRALRGKR